MSTRRFAAHGVVVESGIPLPLLPAPRKAVAEVRFEIHRAGPLSEPRGSVEVIVRGRGGKALVSWWRAGRGIVLRYAGLADFRAGPGLRSVACLPAPGANRRELAALFADAVLPFLLAWRGEFVLHASAVFAPGGAVAFLGPGGAGKSTLAAALGRAGLPILADDALLLRFPRGGPVALPGPPAVRLDRRSRKLLGAKVPSGAPGKVRVALRGRARSGDAGPVPLLRLYVLRRVPGTGKPSVRAMPWRKSIVAIVDALFQADRLNRRRIRSDFVRSECLARKGLVFEAKLPSGLSSI